MTTNGLSAFISPIVVPVTQAGCWRGVSWELRLQMALKSSHYLQACQSSKLRWRGFSWGSQLQIAFKSSYQLQPSQLPKHRIGGALVGGHDYKWPSSLFITCNCAGYPSLVLEGRQLRITTTIGFQVFILTAAVPITQSGNWRNVGWGSRLQMAFMSSYHL